MTVILFGHPNQIYLLIDSVITWKCGQIRELLSYRGESVDDESL